MPSSYRPRQPHPNCDSSPSSGVTMRYRCPKVEKSVKRSLRLLQRSEASEMFGNKPIDSFRKGAPMQTALIAGIFLWVIPVGTAAVAALPAVVSKRYRDFMCRQLIG
jgi:hypothetical protein